MLPLPRFTKISPTDKEARLLWPSWAKRLEKDKHGLHAILPLAPGFETRMRWIPPGKFVMGSPEDEKGRWDDEGPQHWVELSRGFWLADAPCTQAEWAAVMGTEGKAPDHPVVNVSWDECRQFCAGLQARFPGLEARLPTEAEWEYACRAGTPSAFNDGSRCTEPRGKDPALERLGWFSQNSGGGTHKVRETKDAANNWGLFDMHGNVWEWCSDFWSDKYEPGDQSDPTGPAEGLGRVCRGGSWCRLARYCRSACRVRGRPSVRLVNLGFRLASGQVSQASQASQQASSREASGPEARGAPAASRRWSTEPLAPRACASMGDTYEEAISNIREAVGCHLEGLRMDGLPAPPPRAHFTMVDVEAA